jgi:hypothetical protein
MVYAHLSRNDAQYGLAGGDLYLESGVRKGLFNYPFKLNFVAVF